MMQQPRKSLLTYTVIPRPTLVSPPTAPFMSHSTSQPTVSVHSPSPATAPPSGGDSPVPPRSPSSSSPSSPASPLPLKRPNSTVTDNTTASPLPLDDSTRRRRRKVTKTRIFEIPTGPTQPRRFSTGALGVPGRGEKLANIPNIQYAIEKCDSKDPQIEFLHRLLFNSAGQTKKRKSSIRTFSGFMFQSEKERARVRDKILRAHANMLKKVTYLLDLDMHESKEATAQAVLAFLEYPKVIDGKGNRAERERLQKAERKRAEKARAKKRKEEERKKKEEEMKRIKNEAKNKADSDEDGDEDLEFEAKPWIVIAEEREAERRRIQGQEEDSLDEEGIEEEIDGSDGESEESADDQRRQEEERLLAERRRRAEDILLGVDDTPMDSSDVD